MCIYSIFIHTTHIYIRYIYHTTFQLYSSFSHFSTAPHHPRLLSAMVALIDPELAAIDAYGLRHVGGNPFGGDISRPAVFLIDEEGRIVEKMLTENWRVRPTPEMIREKFSGEE